ncbi:MAG: serine--tRNA ligase [Fimbriimonadaceae bacterium]|nr:MAG: serine--tRNA ligase [Fimbriimonadaceae bacterium]
MLDRKLIRENPELVRAGAKRKGIDAPVDEFLQIDQEWRASVQQLEQKKAESNSISKSIGQLMSQGKTAEAEEAKAQTAQLKLDIKDLEPIERELEAKLHKLELQFPNMPHESTPDGLTSEENVEVRAWGEKPSGEFLPHQQIAEDLKIIDFAAGAKVSGSGFVVYTGLGAKLVRALISFMLDFQTERNGYYEVYPPALVSSESLTGTGNLPKFAEDLYKTSDDLWLVPTAEVPVTNLLRDEILDGFQLPIKYAAYTPCFRREAGAAGRDTRGILRMHQFDKVELVKYVHPNESYNELELLTSDAESILQALGLHYRVLLLCAGDMGDKGCKCYDLEVWAPGEERYLEVSSCTNFEAFQSRRTNIRFRPEAGAAPEFVHILNGSGLAIPRLMVALMETYREADGGITIPEPLRRYMGVDRIEPIG